MTPPRTPLLLVAAAAVLSLAACSGDAQPSASTPDAATAAPAPSGDPIAPGETRLVAPNSAFTVSGGETDFDAWPEVQAENADNPAPADGRTFVMFPLSIGYDWPTIEAQAEAAETDISGGVDPTWVLSPTFVGSDGTSYGIGTDDDCGDVPDDWAELGPVFESTTVTGNVCVSVPSDVITGGAWVVSNSENAAVTITAE